MDMILGVVDFLKYIDLLEIIVVILSFSLIRQWLLTKAHENMIKENRLLYDIKFDDSAMNALDSLINEILAEYQILKLGTKELYYINSAMEQEILEYVQDEVSKRISTLLLKKLEYQYNKDYIGTAIGRRIYLSVLDFVLEFNTKNNLDKDDKK